MSFVKMGLGVVLFGLAASMMTVGCAAEVESDEADEAVQEAEQAVGINNLPTDVSMIYLVLNGYTCQRAGSSMYLCSKPGGTDYVCDNAGTCTQYGRTAPPSTGPVAPPPSSTVH